MTLTLNDFCPPADALTLLKFRGEAFQAWQSAPQQQGDIWLREYSLITELLGQASAGPVKLDLP
jgi:hypothetical protein